MGHRGTIKRLNFLKAKNPSNTWPSWEIRYAERQRSLSTNPARRASASRHIRNLRIPVRSIFSSSRARTQQDRQVAS